MKCVRDGDALELAITTDELRFRDFGKVVILGSDPEYRHGLCVSLLQTAGEFHGRERFVNGVKWTSEQPRLLTRNHRDAIRFAQQFDIFERRLACTPTSIHCGKRVA